MRRHVCIAAIVAGAAGCNQSPTAPSGDGGRLLQGQTVSAIDGGAAAGVSVQVGSERPVTTDADGMFQVAVDGPETMSAVLSSNAIVERRTTLPAGGEGRVSLSLIPASFDLEAFDQIARTANSRLQRWTTPPRLVVVASVMNFRSSSEETFPATSEQMTDDEVGAMIAHLTEGLTVMTAGAFTGFVSVDVERPASGTRVAYMREGAIVAGRYNGVTTFASTVGYGRWATQGDGTVTGGAVVLDRDFDRDDSRRRLLRVHELGHALGYQHVTTRTSIMNPVIGPEPTAFDRVAAAIAFQRPPGNRAPDTDPGATASRSPFSMGAGGRSKWAPPVICGAMR